MNETNGEDTTADRATYGVMAGGPGGGRVFLCDTERCAEWLAGRLNSRVVVRRGGPWTERDGRAPLPGNPVEEVPIYPLYHGEGGVSRTIRPDRAKPAKANGGKPVAGAQGCP